MTRSMYFPEDRLYSPRLLATYLFMVTILFVMSGCGSSSRSHRPSGKYYEGLMIRTPAPKKGERAHLIAALPKMLKKRKVFRIKNGRRARVFGGGINKLRQLSHAELRALWISHDSKYRGAELDLKIRLYGHDTTPVTVLVALNGALSVEEGRWKRNEIPKNAAEIERRWSVGPLRVKSGAKWSKRALRSINIALSKLSKTERSLLRGIPFVRKSKGQEASQAALYIQEKDCDAMIQVFNRAIISERYTFSGEAQRALPATVHPILHEIGHAIHSLPGRRIQCEYIDLIDQHNRDVEAANRAQGQKRSQLAAKLKRSQAKIAKLEPLVKRWRARGPVINAYLKVKGKVGGPTPYGATSHKESFAEAFALYHVDPKALRRVMPKVHAWFKSGRYLREAQRRP